MPKNQKKITIASYNYLNEISAIPETTRHQFLQKLLKRKNSQEQKNVKLLNCIYKYVSESRISEWDPIQVSKETGIESRKLYLHRSRLMKGLREYYFDWPKEEKKIDESFKENKEQFKNAEMISIGLKLRKAHRMNKLGMYREANDLFLGLEKEISSLQDLPKAKYLMLGEIYEQLCYFYFNRRNKYRLKIYLEKLCKTYSAAKSSNPHFSLKEESLFKLRIYFAKQHFLSLKWYSSSQTKMSSVHIGRIYSLARKSKNYYYLIRILNVMAIRAVASNNPEIARKLCLEGSEIALKLNDETELYLLNSILANTKLRTDHKQYEKDIRPIIDYYYKIREKYPVNIQTITLENSIAMNYYPDKDKEIREILMNQINSNILLGDFSFAVCLRFEVDSDRYADKISSHFYMANDGENDFLRLGKVDRSVIKDIDRLCLNTLCYRKELNDLGFVWDVYKLRLISILIDETDFDYLKAMVIFRRMERISKSKKKLTQESSFEILKLSQKILEKPVNKTTLINKFEFKLSKLIGKIKNGQYNFDIIDYAIISSLERRLKSKPVTSIVRDFYTWIWLKHPEVIAPVLKLIEEKQNNIYTISESSAA